MSSQPARGTVVPVAVIAVCFALSVLLSQQIDATKPALPESYGDKDLQLNGSRLKGYVLGTESLVADWYYMRSLQYVGNKLLTKSGFINIEDLRDLNARLLYPYLDNATDLDPRFIAAYSYGSLVLPAIDQEKAIAITKKGIANNPNEWRLYQYLGYIYWHAKDYEKAAEYYERGSRVAGAPPFMRMMAGAMKTQGGSRDTARKIFAQMLADNGSDESVAATAKLKLMELDWLDQRDAINGVLAGTKATAGQCPADLRQVMPQLRGVKLPSGDFEINKTGQLVDPSGAPYLVDQQKCEVTLDPKRTAIPHSAGN